MKAACPYAAVVIGASAGGIAAVTAIAKGLPEDFPIPLILALHVRDRTDVDYSIVFRNLTSLKVEEAAEKIRPEAGHLYIAPPGYHLLIERDGTFSLSNDDMVNWARPSIDVLFETAAAAYGSRVLAILLTGANHDGAHGLRAVHDRGGDTFVQDPATAEVAVMPLAAIAAGGAGQVLTLADIHARLTGLAPKGDQHAL